MSLLDILYGQPAPIDGRFVKRVQPLGADESRELLLQAKREDAQRYRRENRDEINRRKRERRAAKR